MKITKNSRKMISFLKKNNYIEYLHISKKTENIMFNLYNDILETNKYI